MTHHFDLPTQTCPSSSEDKGRVTSQVKKRNTRTFFERLNLFGTSKTPFAVKTLGYCGVLFFFCLFVFIVVSAVGSAQWSCTLSMELTKYAILVTQRLVLMFIFTVGSPTRWIRYCAMLRNRTHDMMLHLCATRLHAAMCVQEKERHIIDVTSRSENSCLVLAGCSDVC
jgi:hypothetical protein